LSPELPSPFKRTKKLAAKLVQAAYVAIWRVYRRH
jgi:hypothetical protein